MPSRAAERRARKRQRDGIAPPATEPPPATATAEPPAAAASSADAEPAPASHREWELPLPSPSDELFDGFSQALSAARLITGRKYRYGATVCAGDDHIPVKLGSNKKIFNRDEIHAEMAALKGCERPAGKDILLVRLAPTRPDRRDDGDDDDDDDDAGAKRRKAPAEKLLNARPCEVCERKMVARGIRRCYFTLSSTALGVLAYNPEPGDLPT
jgi:hypothetical protein